MYNSIQDTLIIGKKVVYLPSCHSTNDIAAEIVHAGLFAEGTVVITDNQIKGRGQRGSEWHANPGENLTFSVILSPHFLPIQHQFLISQITALAVRSFVSNYIDGVKVKWPNDVLVNGKKICGILIENSILGMKLTNSIIGIGVNINQLEFENGRATSLAQETESQYILAEEFQKLARIIEAYYLKLRTTSHDHDIKLEYLQHLHGYDQEVKVSFKGQYQNAQVIDVTEQGRLRVKLSSQPDILELGLKEIEWVLD
ncbi:biotin--[acetyl-CoA-carboxylase] ligase [Dyadobacter sp. CY323]|uniref:biotin--[acetyl-CoA-carboxylase] ligase n=1 Tax=Dyadobacter sp. CY323 TaxID=2907302 RepID=UPI001F3DEA07|nr:biotin--[acetyl-CoA-carboxylase] ligase [Dyadobacter sp. CY323]MCE6991612.1 biotin--[acetyl-CoA-carboxylase] ligase [Dyadobacter sp. CY323]